MSKLDLDKILTEGFDISILGSIDKAYIETKFSLSDSGVVCTKCKHPTEPVIKNYSYYGGSHYDPPSETYDIESECCGADIIILNGYIIEPYDLTDNDYENLAYERNCRSI